MINWQRLIKSINQDETSSYQFFQICRFLSWILITITLVKSGLSLESIGSFEYVIFLVGLVSFVWNMGFKNALLTFYPRQKSVSGIFFTSLVIQVLFGVVFGGLLYFYLQYYDHNILADSRHIIFFMVLLMGVSSLPEFYHLLRKESGQLWKYGIIIYSMQLILLVSTALASGSLTHLIWVYTLWLLLKSLYMIYLLLRSGDFNYSKGLFFQILQFSFPYLLYIIVSYGMEYVDGVLVKYIFPIESFSVFKYGARELPISSILVGSLVAASIPQFVRTPDTSYDTLKKKIRYLIYLLYPISILLIVLSPFLYPLFYSTAYRESAWIFNIYLLIVVSRVLVPQIFFVARDKVSILSWIGVVEIIINLTASWYFASIFGLKGIALGTLLAYIAQKIILVTYASSKFKIPLSLYLPVKEYVFFTIILIITFLGTLFLNY